MIHVEDNNKYSNVYILIVSFKKNQPSLFAYWLRIQWCHCCGTGKGGFDPWPGNFHMLSVQPEKKRKEKLACNRSSLFIYLFIFVFLGPYLQHMEVPRLGVESEL